MSTLTEQRLIEIMREEYEARVQKLDEDLKAFMNIPDGDDKEGIIGDETKVRHRDSQLLYTVHEVGPHQIVLRTPEGKLFDVSAEEFEQEYELD